MRLNSYEPTVTVGAELLRANIMRGVNVRMVAIASQTFMKERCVVSDDILAKWRDSDDEFVQSVIAGFDALKKKSDQFWADPYGNTCGLGRPHVISPTVYKNGGYTFCANCFEPLKVDPHD